MRRTLAVGLGGLLAMVSASPAVRAEAPRRTVAPMMLADGAVCDLLRSQAKDRCQVVAQDGAATVYQSGSAAAGVRRLVLAIASGEQVLVSPPVDVIGEQLASTTPTLRAIAIDGQPGVVLDVVATWKPGAPATHRESLVGCTQRGALWKCSQVEVGACDARVAADGAITTSCGTRASLSLD